MLPFKRVAVALSGGIDSAVSALLLKKRGFEVVGIFMKNWDESEASNACSAVEDAEDAQWICNRLNIPFKEVSFVKEFWNHVFLELIAHYNVGMTPNPDIWCNEHIKFGCFHRYCLEKLDVDAVATGHYAQSTYGPFLDNFNLSEPAKLLCGIDDRKDQSFFLSRIPQTALQRSMFPVGTMKKPDVKQIGRENEFDRILKRKESMGICFIGPQKFQNFISEYVIDKPGKFIDVDTDEIVGDHRGLHYWTVGQRCLKHYFVVGNNEKDLIFVAQKNDHPALFCRTLILTDDSWIAGKPKELLNNRLLKCKVKYMHSAALQDCYLVDLRENDMIVLSADEPMYAVATGQFAVFYCDNECLGSAKITFCGPSDVFLPSRAISSEAER